MKALVLLGLLTSIALATDVPVVPLCGRISGFASEVNNKLKIALGDDRRRDNEAIIISVRPSPYNPTVTYLTLPMYANVTYESKGLSYSVVSDRYGVAYIGDPDINGDVNVEVKNLREDGSTPFELFSYHMNYRTCSIVISPQKPFSGPVASHVPPKDEVVGNIYFVARLPTLMTSFIFTISGSSADIFASPTSTEKGTPIQSGAAYPWKVSSFDDIFFTLVPKADKVTTDSVHATIAYQFSSVPPTSPKDPVVSQPPSLDAPVSTTVAPAGPRWLPARVESSSWSGLSLFCVVVFAYFAVRSIYNYRVSGITKYPEYIPHHQVFASVGSLLGAFAVHARNKGRQVASFGSRSGYNAVNRADDYDTSAS